MLIYPLGQPHYKRGTRTVARNDYDCVEPISGAFALDCGVGQHIAVGEEEVITDCGDKSQSYGYYPGDEIHLLLVGLSKLTELGEYDGEKLNNDGCVDVRCNAKRKQSCSSQ